MSYNTLKNKNDIGKVFSSKKTLSDKTLHIKIYPSSVGGVRIVFAMSRKRVNKPMRNKQVRRMRVIAAITHKYIQGYDIAIVIRDAYASFDILKASYKMLIVRMKDLYSTSNV